MLVVFTNTNDPFFNIASEEHFFHKHDEDFCLIYINAPSVIVGKHQNTYEEINLDFVLSENIPVIRRISGGGTVYHDTGNMNFTFITNRPEGFQVDYHSQLIPVTEWLQTLGLTTFVGEKHEITTDGLKFSGNAEHVFRNRVLHHGTLLFSSDIDALGKALEKGKGKYTSRAVQSNRSSVTNLEGKLKGITSTRELAISFSEFMLAGPERGLRYELKEEEIRSICELAAEKYTRWEWNYAYGPAYTFLNEAEIDGLRVTIDLSVKNGIINECEIKGHNVLSSIAAALKGTRHIFGEMKARLSELGFAVTDSELIGFFR